MRSERPNSPLVVVGTASSEVVKLDCTKLYNHFQEVLCCVREIDGATIEVQWMSMVPPTHKRMRQLTPVG